MLTTVPLTIKEAESYLKKHERHYKSGADKICAIGLKHHGNAELHGAAILGRSGEDAALAHIYADGESQGYTILYGACWRALKALGYERVVL